MTDSPNPSPRKLKFEQLRADYELFLQTFEKPTQIYRFLRSRHALSPMFLHRTLSYMKGRRTNRTISSIKKREEFKLKDLLNLKQKELPDDDSIADEALCSEQNNYLNLTFSGFFHGPEFGEEIFQTNDVVKQLSLKDEFVDVELQLIRVFHKKKKTRENDSPVDVVNLGTCVALWNPRTQLLPSSATFSLSIPRKSFQSHVNGRAVKTHILSIQVTVPIERKKTKNKKKSTGDDENPIDKEKDKENEGAEDTPEPPNKKLRKEVSIESATSETDSHISEVDKGKRLYTAEMIVFDKHKNCLLTDGEYELLLHQYWMEDSGDSPSNVGKTWENTFRNKLGAFEMFLFGPTVKFKLNWEDKPVIKFKSKGFSLIEKLAKLNKAGHKNAVANLCPKEKVKSSKSKCVFYQFIYNNNTRQQTEAREDYCCPWCTINCIQLYSLLKHLKVVHSRFIFMYTSLSKGARIDVCLNEAYNAASIYQFRGRSSSIPVIFCEDGPVRRNPQTEILVQSPTKSKEDLTEFAEPDLGEIDGVKPFFKGHDRLYYHSNNYAPILPVEMEQESEDEIVPEWLKDKKDLMIDEFTDVNDGEKELMKLWNVHIMRNGIIADSQLPLACKTFIEEFEPEIISRGLSKNLLIHFCNLCDFNLVSSSFVSSLITTFSMRKNKI